MKFSAQEKSDVLSVLGAILHLGNVNFTQSGGAQIGNEDVLQVVADLLAVDAGGLGEALTNIKRDVRGETITTPLEIREVAVAVFDCLSVSMSTCQSSVICSAIVC